MISTVKCSAIIDTATDRRESWWILGEKLMRGQRSG